MKHLTLPIIAMKFNQTIGKTIIETSSGTVFANGDVSDSPALLVNLTINEIGDTFVAGNYARR